MFTLTSAATFLVLTAACTWGWGEDFLYHGLLYHLGRTDHRHNYSMYFYPIYLTYDDDGEQHRRRMSPETALVGLRLNKTSVFLCLFDQR